MAFDTQAYLDRVNYYMHNLFGTPPMQTNAPVLPAGAAMATPVAQPGLASQIGGLGGKYIGLNAGKYIGGLLNPANVGTAGESALGSTVGGGAALGSVGALGSSAALGGEAAGVAGESALGAAGAAGGGAAGLLPVLGPAAILAAPFLAQKYDLGGKLFDTLGLHKSHPARPIIASEAFANNSNFDQVPGLNNLTGTNQQSAFDLGRQLGLIRTSGYGVKQPDGTIVSNDPANNPYWFAAPRKVEQKIASDLGMSSYGGATWYKDPRVQAELAKQGGLTPNLSTDNTYSNIWKDKLSQLESILGPATAPAAMPVTGQAYTAPSSSPLPTQPAPTFAVRSATISPGIDKNGNRINYGSR